ncbi:hypothetical protein L0668_07420 [Paraglaciecola aquimarina]|uniref:PEP-CTERM sorting domain-containing protein n=1 Tax=Paraglaciecola algarum TaxID=3050085 RepID=A0ABS9D4U3_9ALTE|nr:hypothetical protein [Paraglaciecola sp. G1-23]MCF2947930.1 hypothetical protein [Paraglaciecola sp. G1-23]
MKNKMFNMMFTCMILSVSCFTNAGLISTFYASDNGGDNGGAVYFDLNINNNDLIITGFDINSSTTNFFSDFEVWLLNGLTSQGNETSSSWVKVATGSGTSADEDNATAVTLSNSFTLNANTLFGMSLVAGSNTSHEYTNGNASNQNYANTDLSLSFGSATNSPFLGGVFTPRVWNGAIKYDIASNAVPSPSSISIFAFGILLLLVRQLKK